MLPLLALLKPLRLPLLYAALGAIVIAGAWRAGVNAERARGEAAWLRVELETLRADVAAAEAARISAEAVATALAQQHRKLTEDIDALTRDLTARPDGDRYPAIGADLDRLYRR